MLSNLSKTLHTQRKLKNKQVAKVWSLYLKKQKIGATMYFPEGLENTPFTALRSTGFPWQSACNWLNEQEAGAPESRQNLNSLRNAEFL